MLCTFCTCVLQTVFISTCLEKESSTSPASSEPCWPGGPWPCGWRSSNEYCSHRRNNASSEQTEQNLVCFIMCFFTSVCESVCTCILMLDRMMRRVILLSEAELRSLSKFLFMRYCLNAVWIVFAARRDTNGPPYFLSSISTYQAVRSRNQSEREEQKRSLHLQETGNKTVETFSEPLWCCVLRCV